MATKKNSTPKGNREIEHSFSEAINVIATATAEAVKAISGVTAESSKYFSAKSDADHDILIELKTKMEDLKKDIKDMKDGSALQISDHETRLRTQERFTENLKGKYVIIGLVVMFIVGIIGSYVSRVIITPTPSSSTTNVINK